jgi:hypothetical protein
MKVLNWKLTLGHDLDQRAIGFRCSDLISLLTIVLLFTVSASAQDLIVDGGVVFPGDQIRGEFILNNPLAEDLVIGKIKKSCSCILVNGLPKVISASSSVKITVSLPASGNAMVDSSTIVIAAQNFDSGHYEIYRLTLTAKVQNLLGLSRDIIEVPSVGSRIIEVVRANNSIVWDALTCEPLEGAKLRFRADVEIVDSSNVRFSFGRLREQTMFGVLKQNFKIRFSYKGVSLDRDMSFSLKSNADGPWIAKPSVLLIGGTTPEQIRRASISLARRAGMEMDPIVAVDCDDPQRVTAQLVDESTEEHGKVIEVTFIGTKPYGNVSSEILVRLQSGKTLIIPYIASVALPDTDP